MSENPDTPLVVEEWPLERLKPYPRNNKAHDAASVEKLAKSMAGKDGQITPVIVQKNGMIIAGHGRRLAAQKLGWKFIKVVVRDVDDATAQKMRIADNRTSNQQYDFDNLRADLDDMDFSDIAVLDEIGISQKELSVLMPEDLGSLEENGDVVSDDIDADVEEFSREGEEHLAEADEKDVPLGRAFGFSKMKAADARIIKKFMMVVQSETGAEGLPALTSWINEKVLAP